jgi:hypothetical protein
MEPLQLDWSTAEVSDGTLTVALSAKPPKDWRETFERTAVLLSSDRWAVTLNSKKGSVQVAAVETGDEDRVRQFLEGAVLEANSTLVSEDELFDNQRADDEEDEPDEPARSPDEEQTGRFREYGREPQDDDSDEGDD